MIHPLPTSIDETLSLLGQGGYVAGRDLATVLFLALKLERPLFVEGEPGTGKTEIAKVLSATLGRRLIRLQCYEGLDAHSAMYEWNYQRQLLAIKLLEHDERGLQQKEQDIFSERYLLKRPLLEAITGDAPPGPDGAPRTGTTVRFWPDPTIFDEVEFRAQTLIERLREIRDEIFNRTAARVAGIED